MEQLRDLPLALDELQIRVRTLLEQDDAYRHRSVDRKQKEKSQSRPLFGEEEFGGRDISGFWTNNEIRRQEGSQIAANDVGSRIPDSVCSPSLIVVIWSALLEDMRLSQHQPPNVDGGEAWIAPSTPKPWDMISVITGKENFQSRIPFVSRSTPIS
jgi:hypothetical protein